MTEQQRIPKTTNLEIPIDLRRQIEDLAKKDSGRSFKGMILVLLREAISVRK